ncbi:MAG: YihY/virulence factor BrkB family protein [Iamia sp.]
MADHPMDGDDRRGGDGADKTEATDDGGERGRSADDPRQVPAKGWKDIVARTAKQMKADNVILMAAGVAFYALLSLVPALVAMISIYGLVADPAEITKQVDDALAAAPAEVRDLLSEQMTSVTEQSSGGLGLALGLSIALAVWSASGGMKHLMTAITVAYDEEESRGFFALRGTAILLTVGAVVFVVGAIGVITVVPALLADTSLGGAAQLAVSIARWPLLGLGLMAGLAVLYRYGPDRDQPQWSWTGPGSIVAVILWLIASIAFSFYTANFSSYGETYGSLGAVVVLMLWLMISAAAVIIGAEINAEAEHQTRSDTTTGESKPMGRRDAEVADTAGASTDDR